MFTKEQIDMLCRLESGCAWRWYQSDRDDGVLRFLLDSGYCAPREDVAPGWIELTEKGRAALADLRVKEAERTDRRREKELTEATRLKERKQDRADEERRYRTQNKIAIIMSFVTFVLGILVEHFYGVFAFLFS